MASQYNTRYAPPASYSHPYRPRRRRRRLAPVLLALALGLLALFAAVTLINWLRPRAQSALQAAAAQPQDTIPQPAEAGGEETAQALETLRGMLAAHPGLDALLQNPDSYPARLIELAARNAEAIPFVLGWPGHEEPAAPADITPELARGGIPAFYQWDSRWGYAPYAGGMVGLDGCGPVCLSMAAAGLTGNAENDPLSMARFAEANGYSEAGTGTSWALMTEGAAQLGLSSQELPLDENALRGALAAGPVILSVRPGDFTTTGHFVLVAGIAPDGGFTIHDPNSMANSGQSWSYERLAPQIKNLWAISLP